MRPILALLLAVLLNLSSNAWADSLANPLTAEPAVNIKPDEVVQIVVDALRLNDSEAGDKGIAAVWRFAAPSNKAITGPLPRFSQMLKIGFADMLDHVSSDFGPVDIDNDVAVQPLSLIHI